MTVADVSTFPSRVRNAVKLCKARLLMQSRFPGHQNLSRSGLLSLTGTRFLSNPGDGRFFQDTSDLALFIDRSQVSRTTFSPAVKMLKCVRVFLNHMMNYGVSDRVRSCDNRSLKADLAGSPPHNACEQTKNISSDLSNEPFFSNPAALVARRDNGCSRLTEASRTVQGDTAVAFLGRASRPF